MKKTNSMFERVFQLSQAQLESMSITRQNTIVVQVNKEVELPIMQLRGADVTVGNGKVVVRKQRRRKAYCGNVTKAVHSFCTEYGESCLRVHKDGDVIFTFTGNVNTLHDRYDIIDALEKSINFMERDVYNDNLQKMQESVFQSWLHGKKAYDAREKREERSWQEREESDMEKIFNSINSRK